ncbi:Phosphoribosyl-ATP pyrophosphatase [Methyloligella halotolerans]|uniref:Phosphoribosyl-ATP pyrophosphatase n=1 Tax=Methyloligella halotolerans TaxID=1177755 RepID=A0A1E2S0R3_9HYPH|nr:phosphoribosyl-ATP diphosphatase [Methyloligella halotolerans]ODA68051.1 Phosphoribosyl-ATP pyrophosphatase [Methyloligella halotolerans]
MSSSILEDLAATIRSRRSADPAVSYTRRLIDGAPLKPAKKLGEEAVETVIAAMSESDKALTGEAADLLYHLLVVLECRNIDVADVLKELEARVGTSGIEEKQRRSTR